MSSILLSREALEEVRVILEPRHFYAEANRRVYEAALELAGQGRPVDTISVATFLRDRGRLDQIGGTPHLAKLVDATPAVAHVEEHASTVKEKARLRHFLEENNRIGVEARAGHISPDDGVEQLRKAIEAPPARRDPTGFTIDSVLDAWRAEGPLVHESTGIQRLDELTGGGPVYGSRWYLSGAPDAGKTALLIQLAHVWAGRGVTVGMLAVDEEPGDLVARIAQRVGYRRSDTERRDSGTLAAMARALETLPFRFYGAEWTIDAAADDLRKAAGDGRAALLVDSIQTVQCDLERLVEREMAEVQAVTARSKALRTAATAHRLIAIATSELGRSSYSSAEARRSTSTLAGSKWSGAIEYSARVLLGLRSVEGEPDLIDLEIAKNKHGPRDEHVYLRIDRGSQSLWQTDYEEPPEDDGEAERTESAKARVLAVAAEVLAILQRSPGMTGRAWEDAGRAATGTGSSTVRSAIASLVDAGRVSTAPGPRRATLYYPSSEAPRA